MKNQLTTTKTTTLALSKTKSLMGITAKILEGKGTALAKAEPSQELATHEGIVMIDGLMWEKETSKEKMEWGDAMEYAKNLRLGGYDDWRLPTIEELGSVVTFYGGEFAIECEGEYGECVFSTLEPEEMPYGWRERSERNVANDIWDKLLGFNGNSHFWSSTIGLDGVHIFYHKAPIGDNHAWVMCPENGLPYLFEKTDSVGVRCVRVTENKVG